MQTNRELIQRLELSQPAIEELLLAVFCRELLNAKQLLTIVSDQVIPALRYLHPLPNPLFHPRVMHCMSCLDAAAAGCEVMVPRPMVPRRLCCCWHWQ